MKTNTGETERYYGPVKAVVDPVSKTVILRLWRSRRGGEYSQNEKTLRPVISWARRDLEAQFPDFRINTSRLGVS